MNTFIDCFMRGFADGLMMMTPEAQPAKTEQPRKRRGQPKKQPKQKSYSADGLWMLVTVAAKVSKVPRRTVRRWVANREVAVHTVRGKKYINVDELRSRYQ
jgi:hypothetical protein